MLFKKGIEYKAEIEYEGVIKARSHMGVFMTLDGEKCE